MSRDQNAGRIHSVRIDNSTFDRVEDFKYLGTTLTNQNSFAEEIKSRLKSGNACYRSAQNIFFFQVVIKKFKDQDIQGVPGGKDLTSGSCSLGQTVPI